MAKEVCKQNGHELETNENTQMGLNLGGEERKRAQPMAQFTVT